MNSHPAHTAIYIYTYIYIRFIYCEYIHARNLLENEAFQLFIKDG